MHINRFTAAEVQRQLISHPAFVSSRSVAVFLGTTKEVDTGLIVQHLLTTGETYVKKRPSEKHCFDRRRAVDKVCYVPYTEDVGGDPPTAPMRLVSVEGGIADVESFVLNRWQIPQPAFHTLHLRKDGMASQHLRALTLFPLFLLMILSSLSLSAAMKDGDLDLIIVPGIDPMRLFTLICVWQTKRLKKNKKKTNEPTHLCT